jgi:hypothetical protein
MGAIASSAHPWSRWILTAGPETIPGGLKPTKPKTQASILAAAAATKMGFA